MKQEFLYSELELETFGLQLGEKLVLGERVILEGPMGAGKTTLTRSILRGLQIKQPPEGSPSFAIAHEYTSPRGGIVHLDFYRIRNELELDEAGIPTYFWERPLIVISEWLSLWPTLESQVLKSGRCFKIHLSFSENDSYRKVQIEKLKV